MTTSSTKTTQQLRQQQISKQQIRFSALLQLSGTELSHHIEAELEENPALEEDVSSPEEDPKTTQDPSFEYSSYKRSFSSQDVAKDSASELQIAAPESLQQHLRTQLGFLSLPVMKQKIGEQLIGSLDADGYLRRPLVAIANDLHKTGLRVQISDIEAMLSQIQAFDPPGIAARNLKECLLLQVTQLPQNPATKHATDILQQHYEAFTKKHFTKITQKLTLSEKKINEALQLILHLNPKPGEVTPTHTPTSFYPLPDFILHKQGKSLEVQLHQPPVQHLRISQKYTQMLQHMQQQNKKDPNHQETLAFIQKKIEAAKWFLQALVQREHTLFSTARIIIKKQAAFFESGDPIQLRPLILKQIAEEVGVDASTISRIVNKKHIQTPFGMFSLRYFFTQGVPTVDKEPVSSRAIKEVLQQLISQEDKQNTLSDEALQHALKAQGYVIARRTVTKYREQLQIPIARLRKAW